MNPFKPASTFSTLGMFMLAAAPAFAVVVTPPGQSGAGVPVVIQGPMQFTKGGMKVPCATTLRGTVDGAGKLRITAAAFSGDFRCGKIAPSASEQTPWTGKFDSASQLTIDNMNVNVKVPLFGGQCGPSQIVVGITDTGKELLVSPKSVRLSGGCGMSGQLTVTPYLHVTP
jgi:hypothetical protein